MFLSSGVDTFADCHRVIFPSNIDMLIFNKVFQNSFKIDI